MFVPAIDAAVIRIPKTGSSSLDNMLHNTYGRDNCYLHGHVDACHMVSEVLRRNLARDQRSICIYATIRHPTDRLVSAINHLYGGSTAGTLNDAMEAACIDWRDPAASIVFRPQHTFLNISHIPCVLVRLENLQALAQTLGCKEEERYDNPSVKRFNKSQIRMHPRFYEAMERYHFDQYLYERAT